jgi:hypothetical protein
MYAKFVVAIIIHNIFFILFFQILNINHHYWIIKIFDLQPYKDNKEYINKEYIGSNHFDIKYDVLLHKNGT